MNWKPNHGKIPMLVDILLECVDYHEAATKALPSISEDERDTVATMLSLVGTATAIAHGVPK